MCRRRLPPFHVQRARIHSTVLHVAKCIVLPRINARRRPPATYYPRHTHPFTPYIIVRGAVPCTKSHSLSSRQLLDTSKLSTSVFSSSRSVVSLCGCADSSTSPLRISPSDYILSGFNSTRYCTGSISISPQKRYQYTHPATTFSRSSHSLMWPSSLHPQTYVLQSLCMTYLSKTVCSGPPCLAFPQSGSHRRQGRRVKREIRKKRFVLKVQAFINQSNTI